VGTKGKDGRNRKKRKKETHEITVGFPSAPGVAKQVVFNELLNVVQMFPIEQGEKAVTFFSETGDLFRWFRVSLWGERERGAEGEGRT
jgi:hypothetical protein